MFNFNLPESEKPTHECNSHREGDLMIFICPQCDYVRQINYKTGKMKTSGGDGTTIHHGVQSPQIEKAPLLHITSLN